MTQTMTPQISDNMLNKIRNLLALADNDGATPDERQLASERAAQMMARYAVDQAMLTAATPAGDDPIENRIITIPSPYVTAKVLLLAGIAEAMNVKPIMLDRSTGKMRVFGRHSDLDCLDFLFTLLLVQASAGAAAMTWPEQWLDFQRTPSNMKRLRRGFFVGFARAIAARLREGRTEGVRAAGTGAELVLRDRAAAAQAALTEMHPKVRQFSIAGGLAAGRSAGAAAGRSADMGQSRVGTRRTALR